MRASTFRSVVSAVLILTSFATWSAPAGASPELSRRTLRQSGVEGKEQQDKLRTALLSSDTPASPAAPERPGRVPNPRLALPIAAAGVEQLQIAALPVAHDIDYQLPGRFLSGRVPAGKAAIASLKPSNIPHPQLATQWIGVVSVFEDLLGSGRGLDDVNKKKAVDRSDLRAQDVQDLVAKEKGLLLVHVNFETKGLTPGGLPSGAKGGDRKGVRTPTISDVVEHTTAFVLGEPGASSMQLDGLGAETFGSFPDEARALMVATHINPALESAALERNGAKTVDEFLDPELPVDQLARRVAELNGVHLDKMDVTILTGDDADIQALAALQQTYQGMQVYRVKAGTVAPSIAAVLGVNDGRVRLFLRRSGMTEAVYMAILAGVFNTDGSYANFRVVSEQIKSEFTRRYDWNETVLAQMQVLRPDDWEQIRDGKVLFSSRQVVKPVTGAYTFLADGRTDLGLPFHVEGVRQKKGISTVYSLVFASNSKKKEGGFLWGSLDGYRIPVVTTAAGVEQVPVIGYLPKLTGKDAELSKKLLEGDSSAKGQATKILNAALGKSPKEFQQVFGRLLLLSQGDMEVFAQTFERALAKQMASTHTAMLDQIRLIAQDPGAPHNLPPVSYFNPARYVYARLQKQKLDGFVRGVLKDVVETAQGVAASVDLSDVRQKKAALNSKLKQGRQTSGPYQYEVFWDSLIKKDGETYLTLEFLLDGERGYEKGVVLELQVVIPAAGDLGKYRSPYRLVGVVDSASFSRETLFSVGLLDPIHFINTRFPEWRPVAQRDVYESRLQALKDSGEKNKRQFIRPSTRQGNNPRFFEPFIRAFLAGDVPLAYHIVDALASERDYGNQGGVGSVANLGSAIVRRGGIGATASWLAEQPNVARDVAQAGRTLKFTYEKDHHRIDNIKDVAGFASELEPFLWAYWENLTTGWPSANLQDETKFINQKARGEMLKAGEAIAQTGVIDEATFGLLQATYNGSPVAEGLPSSLGLNWLRNRWLHHVVDTLVADGVPLTPFNRWYIEPDYALDGKPQTVEELSYLTMMSWVSAQAHGYPLGLVVPSYGNVHGASAGNPSLALAGILQYAAQAATLYGEPLPADLLAIAQKAPHGYVGLAGKAAGHFKDTAGIGKDFETVIEGAGERTEEEEARLSAFVLAQLRKIPADILKTLKVAEQALLTEVAAAQKAKKDPRPLEEVAQGVASDLDALTARLDQEINQLPIARRAGITTHAASGLSAQQLSKARDYGVIFANKSTEFQNVITKQLEVIYLMSVDKAEAMKALAQMPAAQTAWNAHPMTDEEIRQVADLYARMYDAAVDRAIKAAKTEAEKEALRPAKADPLRPFPWFWKENIGWSMVDPSGKDWGAYEWLPGAHGRYMFSMRDTMTGEGTTNSLLFPNALTWGLPPTVIEMAQAEIERTIHFYHQPSVMNAVGGAAEFKAKSGVEQEVAEAIAELDSPKMAVRLAALRKLRELQKQDVAIPIVGPALPSYVHVHSTASYPAVPGVVSPARMVWAAHQAGAREIFLVDHETLLHIEEGFQAVKIVNEGVKRPLRPVFGVEFKAPVSAQWTALRAALQDGVAAGDAAWVVAWGVPVDADGKVPQGLVNLVGEFQKAKRERAMDQALRLERELNDGFDLNSVLGLSPDRNITDRQLAYAAAIQQLGSTASSDELNARASKIRQEVIGPVPLSSAKYHFPSYETTVALLVQLGMVPTFTMQVKVPALPGLMKDLKEIGLQAFDIAGLEHHHAKVLDDVRTVIALAKKNSMPVLGGVDYRGDGAIGWPQAADWMKNWAIREGIDYMLTRPSSAVPFDDGLGNWMDRFGAGVEQSNLRKAIELGSIFCFDFLENISDALIEAAMAGGATEFTMNPYSTGNYIQHLITLNTAEGQAWAKKLYLLKEDAASWVAFKKELEDAATKPPAAVYKAIKAAMEPSPDVKPENERELAQTLIKSMLAESRAVVEMLDKLVKQGVNGEQAYWEISKYFARKIAQKAEFVSIEVDPRLEREEFARSQPGNKDLTVPELQQWMATRMKEQARDLAEIAPNILVKVPNSPAGLATVREVNAHFNVTLTFADDDATEAIAAYEARKDPAHILRISPFVSRNAVYFEEFWGGLMEEAGYPQRELDGHAATIANMYDIHQALGPYAKGAIWSSLGMKIKGDPGELYARQVIGTGILNVPPETARDFNRAEFVVKKRFWLSETAGEGLTSILTGYFSDVYMGKVPSAVAKFPQLASPGPHLSPWQQAGKAAKKWSQLINRPVDSARLGQVEARIGELEAAAGNKKRAFTREAVAIARAMLQAGSAVTEKTLMRLVLKKEGEEKFITPFQGAINLLQTTLDDLRKVAAGVESAYVVPELQWLTNRAVSEAQVVHAIARRSEYSRWKDLQIITKAKSGHPGGTLSAVEIMETLYDPDVMRINPNDRAIAPEERWLNRDRLVLSKGHAVPIQYVALANAGILTNAEIEQLRQDPANFAQGHATLSITPGIDFSTGALGYGAPAAAGIAVAARMDGRDFHTFTVIGDGEMEKGPIYEMMQMAPVLGLDNLTAVVDYNHYQQNYNREKYTQLDYDKLAEVWELAGWNVVKVDGDKLADNVRYITELRRAMIESKTRKNGRPTVILANTIKGRGVSLTENLFREGVTKFHGSALDAKQYEEATREIAPRLGIAVENRSLADIEADLEKIGEEIRQELGTRQLTLKQIAEIDMSNMGSSGQAFLARTAANEIPLPAYQPGGKPVATREASGAAWTHFGSLRKLIPLPNGRFWDPTKIVLVSPSDLQDSESFKEFGKVHGIFSPRTPFGRLIELGIMETAGFKLAEGIAATGLGYLPVVGTFDRFVAYEMETLNHAAQDNLAMVVNASHGGSETGPDGTSQYSVQTPAEIYSLTDEGNRVEMFESSDAIGTLTDASLALTSGKVSYLRLGRSPRPILDRSQAVRVTPEKGVTVWKEPAGTDRADITLVASGATVAHTLEAAKLLEQQGLKVAVVEVTSVTRLDDRSAELSPFPWGAPASPFYEIYDASPQSLRLPLLEAEKKLSFSVSYPVPHRNILTRGITVTGSGSTDTMFKHNRFTAAQIAEDAAAIVAAFRTHDVKLIPAGIVYAGVEQGELMFVDAAVRSILEAHQAGRINQYKFVPLTSAPNVMFSEDFGDPAEIRRNVLSTVPTSSQKVRFWIEKSGNKKAARVEYENLAGVFGGVFPIDDNPWMPGAGVEQEVQQAQESAVGFVVDAGLAWLSTKVPLNAPFMAVAAGTEQAKVLQEAGVPVHRILVLVADERQTAQLTDRAFSGDNIFVPGSSESWDQALDRVWSLAGDWLNVLDGLQPKRLRTTALTAAGLLQELPELLAAAGVEQTGAITADMAEQVSRVNQLGV